MKQKYIYFNIACIAISVFFAVSILWRWNRSFVNLENKNVPVEITLKKDILVKKIETEIIKKEINLAVPFTSQAPEKNWHEPWQDACEEAAVLMLDAYYKNYKLSPLFVRDEILKMVAWEEAQGWGTSIEMEKIVLLAKYYLPVKAKITTIKNPTITQIKKIVAAGQLVLVVADGKVLPNPHFQNDGPEDHALIIRGYTDDSFITNDPGTQFGENFLYKYNDLMNAIHDWNNGDVKNGRAVILTVE